MRYYLIIMLLVLISCSNNTKKQAQLDNTRIRTEKVHEASLTPNKITEKVSKSEPFDTIPKNGVKLIFKDFKLLIDNIEVWDEEGDLKKVQKDTVRVYLDIGEILIGNSIRIIDSDYDQIKIYQKIENSITIMNEGPHCDLLEWKHYNSEWEEIKSISQNHFQANALTEEQMSKFISISTEDLKRAVKLHCGENWVELIKDIKSINEYPCGVGTSKIFLKLLMTKKESTQSIEKIIEFDVPMGC